MLNMNAIVRLYSKIDGQISSFLSHYYKKEIKLNNDLLWEKEFENPIEIADIIAALIENKDEYKVNMWISLDEDLFINITPNNADDVIRYLFERYPY